MPVTPVESLSNREVEPQTNKNFDIVTCVPSSADWTEMTSDPRVPVVAMGAMTLSGKRVHVLLVQPGLAGE